MNQCYPYVNYYDIDKFDFDLYEIDISFINTLKILSFIFHYLLKSYNYPDLL